METKYDLFIAYHGDEITGSLGEATEIYEKLKNIQVDGRKIHIFFFPASGLNGSFGETQGILLNQVKLLLFVANENVGISAANDGAMRLNKENDEIREIAYELQSFEKSHSMITIFPSTTEMNCFTVNIS